MLPCVECCSPGAGLCLLPPPVASYTAGGAALPGAPHHPHPLHAPRGAPHHRRPAPPADFLCRPRRPPRRCLAFGQPSCGCSLRGGLARALAMDASNWMGKCRCCPARAHSGRVSCQRSAPAQCCGRPPSPSEACPTALRKSNSDRREGPEVDGDVVPSYLVVTGETSSGRTLRHILQVRRSRSDPSSGRRGAWCAGRRVGSARRIRYGHTRPATPRPAPISPCPLRRMCFRPRAPFRPGQARGGTPRRHFCLVGCSK